MAELNDNQNLAPETEKREEPKKDKAKKEKSKKEKKPGS